MKRLLIAAATTAFILPLQGKSAPKFTYQWVYLMQGEESSYSPTMPITDIGYFSAGISSTGRLGAVPKRPTLKGYTGRIHLVVAETGNYALSHMVLNPEFGRRDRLVSDIVKGAESYDGVQIDFEAIIPSDRAHFTDFIAELKKALPKDKILSLALPARRKTVEDAFSYRDLGAIADQIIIMSYDQHWSTSKPGPVSSLDWSLEVKRYARSQIPDAKIIYGVPFYGRAWVDRNPARAYRLKQVPDVIAAKNSIINRTKDGIPYTRYTDTVQVTMYYDDIESFAKRIGNYLDAGVSGVAFWRLGQELPDFWHSLSAPE